MSADPQNLGPYRIVRRVGAGGMGVVYEAVHTGLDKRIALKVLPRELAANRLERFLREARTAAALHHTNIVPVFDVGQVDGVPYFAMQFIDGRPLDAVARTSTRGYEPEGTKSFSPTPDATTDHVSAGAQSGPSALTPGSPTQVVSQILQAAEGVAHAHDRGVVHRDIKPANLLLDASGVVWVADFGLAFRPGDPTMTADGAVIGTPRYMSPEQARGEKTDARTDVYSLGVTLYELLTGAIAFPGETLVEVLQRVMTHTPPPPRSLDRRISTDLERVVLKAMAKRREDRYASGREFADDLRRYLNGEPVRARRIGPVGKAWRWSKRNPAVASLLAAVLLVFALGAGASAYYAAQAETREGEAKRNEKKAINKEAEATAERRKVEDAARANRQLLYAARMSLAGAALKDRNYDRVSELLGETLPAAGDDDPRGWEWHYLFRQVHAESRVVRIELPRGTLHSSEGRHLVPSDDELRVREYDPESGRLRHEWPAPPGLQTFHMQASADGRRLALTDNAGRIVVWDVPTRTVLLSRPGESPQLFNTSPALAFGADGNRLAAASIGRGGVEVFDLTAPKAKRTFAASLPDHIRTVAFSPDGSRVLAVAVGECHVFDTVGRAAPHVLRCAGKEFLRDIFFRADGKRVLASGRGGFWEWDLTRPTVVRPGGSVPPDTLTIRGAKGMFSPDGEKLVLGSAEEMRIVTLAGGREFVLPTSLFGVTLDHHGLAWSDDGRWVAVAVRAPPVGPLAPPVFGGGWANLATAAVRVSRWLPEQQWSEAALRAFGSPA